jgi:hypothetical protein
VKKILQDTALAILLLLTGCVAGPEGAAPGPRFDFHAAAATALGLLTAAEKHPELVLGAKLAVSALAAQASPEHAARVQEVLGRLDAGSLDEARELLSPVVAATSPGQ